MIDAQTPIFPEIKIEQNTHHRGPDVGETKLRFDSIVRVQGSDKKWYLVKHALVYEFPLNADKDHILSMREELMQTFYGECYNSIYMIKLPMDFTNEDGDQMYPEDMNQMSEKDRLLDVMNRYDFYKKDRKENQMLFLKLRRSGKASTLARARLMEKMLNPQLPETMGQQYEDFENRKMKQLLEGHYNSDKSVQVHNPAGKKLSYPPDGL